MVFSVVCSLHWGRAIFVLRHGLTSVLGRLSSLQPSIRDIINGLFIDLLNVPVHVNILMPGVRETALKPRVTCYLKRHEPLVKIVLEYSRHQVEQLIGLLPRDLVLDPL